MVLRKRALLTLGAAAALGMGLVACTPAGPVGPTLTPISTPAETEIERQTRLDFEAAEKAYRTFIAEFDRLTRAGGAEEPTPLLKKTGAGPFLKGYMETLKSAKRSGAYSTGATKILWFESGSYSTEELQLTACVDGRGIQIFDSAGKKLGTGLKGIVTIRARPVDGVWKIWDTESKKDETCGR